MASRTTIIWLLAAVVLGAGAFILLRTPKGAPAGTPGIGERLITLDPATVRSIRIEHPDGSSELIERGSDPEWTMRIRVAGAPADSPAANTAWPVEPQRIQALLRHVTETVVRALPTGTPPADDRADQVVIEREGAGPLTLRLSGQSVGGKALIEVTDPAKAPEGREPRPVRVVVDDTLHLLFRSGAPREWRDRTALRGVGLDASRLTMRNNQGVTLALGRSEGVWGLREPVAAPADPAAVQRLLGALAGVQIVDFLDQGAPQRSMQLESPAAEVTIEKDRRQVGAGDEAARIVTDSHTLAIGGAADAAGTRLFARIDGERTVVIDARAVADLKLEPGLYIWPHPTTLNPADIGTIVLERASESALPGAVYRRELERWKHVRADGEEVLLPTTEERPVLALLTFLTGPAPTPVGAPPAPPPAGPIGAAAISITAPEGLTTLGRIALRSLSGAPLDTLEVASARPGTVVIRTGPVYRTYTLDRVPSLVAEFTQAPAPAGAPAADGSTPPPEPTK